MDKERILKIIAQIMNKNSRETDLKGWFDNHTMAILLPDTPYASAKILCNKLIKLCKARLNDCLKNDFSLEDCFAITSYPEIVNDYSSKSKLSEKVKKLDPVHIQINKKTSALRNDLEKYSNKSDKLQLSLFPNEFNASCSVMVQRAIKRLTDIIGSLVGITLLLPAFFIIAIAIRLTSPGPIFFKQKRVGLNGKTFTFLKFRSMYHNCDQTVYREHINKLSKGEIGLFQNSQNGVLSYKLQDDPRITKLGRFLRATSLDELPQLFNVLKGDMSLIGPRPYPPYEIENCKLWQHSRLTIKPGITGLAQLYGRYNKTYIDVYRLDLQYIEKWSLWLDFKILIKTMPSVISGRGAQ
jgi:lipopolysaccharide/colanic/teichoic acid biosynthesis glycosyltransferase